MWVALSVSINRGEVNEGLLGPNLGRRTGNESDTEIDRTECYSVDRILKLCRMTPARHSELEA